MERRDFIAFIGAVLASMGVCGPCVVPEGRLNLGDAKAKAYRIRRIRTMQNRVRSDCATVRGNTRPTSAVHDGMVAIARLLRTTAELLNELGKADAATLAELAYAAEKAAVRARDTGSLDDMRDFTDHLLKFLEGGGHDATS